VKSKTKDTKRWCKDKLGRGHLIVVKVGKHDYQNKACHEDLRWAWLNGRWRCFHVRECENCGKVLAMSADACPDKPIGVR